MDVYLVRMRDILSGSEHWLRDSGGDRFQTDERRIADAVALAMSRYQPTELAYVVDIDPRYEQVID